jgi:hypothetical protein
MDQCSNQALGGREMMRSGISEQIRRKFLNGEGSLKSSCPNWLDSVEMLHHLAEHHLRAASQLQTNGGRKVRCGLLEVGLIQIVVES